MLLNRFLFVVILSSLISMVGTMLGASIGVFIKNPGKRLLSGIMSFAAGLMLAVVVFDLIPEAIGKSSVLKVILYYFAGIIIIMFIESTLNTKDKPYIKVAMITALGIMLHNLPEGVIMGCGFAAGQSLGFKMSIIIAIHDIPEGIAVTAPLMASRVRPLKILLYAFITALPTAIGAVLGVILGGISESSLSICLSVASGIMMYVVFGELIPESNKTWHGITNTLSILLGITIGLIMVTIL